MYLNLTKTYKMTIKATFHLKSHSITDPIATTFVKLTFLQNDIISYYKHPKK